MTEDEDQQYLSNEIEHIVMPNDTLQGKWKVCNNSA